jgi:UDP-N-acetylglucosamine--dolichyl-phosphate N-acetylglucosaminephosphotransferase
MQELAVASTIAATSFLSTLLLTRKWVRLAGKMRFVGKDLNKNGDTQISDSGGIVVALAVCVSLLLYISLKTFYWRSTTHLVDAFALCSTVLLAAFLGFTDDVLGWKQGLTQLQKVVLTFPIALPLMVTCAGYTVVDIPVVGAVNFGVAYPLLWIPIGIVGATNGFNMLAGYNGIEAGMALIIFTAFGATGIIIGRYWIALITFIAVASLLAFLRFNWYPAKVFPGNSLTYSMGSLIAAVAIIGNMEKLALWLFLPYFAEGLLYLKARLVDNAGDVQAFAIPKTDGSLTMPYPKIYDFTHLSIWLLSKMERKVYEKHVVWFTLLVEAFLAFSGVLLLIC